MGLLKISDTNNYNNFQAFADTAPEQEYPTLSNVSFAEKGEITLADVQELATAKPTDDMFVVYLQQYIERLTTVLDQINAMKQAEKPLKQRLKDSQKLLDKLMREESTSIPPDDVWNTWDVTSEHISDLTDLELPITTLPMTYDSDVNDDFKHML